MNLFPRIALGSLHHRDQSQPLLWAILNVLNRSGLQVQSYSSQSRCDENGAALAITGQRRRCLDSWLMQPEICTDLFLRGSRCADIAVVDGLFDVARERWPSGGSLDTLCEWLDLPRLGIVNAQRIETCLLPRVPQGLDGLILDQVSGVRELCHLQTLLESCYGIPVVAAMLASPDLRAVVGRMGEGRCPTPELCNALGDALSPHLRLEQLLEIAHRREFGEHHAAALTGSCATGALNVAIAYDAAFSCYFPDTLDVLESQGASVNFFSPLNSESLPPGTDVVYLGCGKLGQYVSELSANVCMRESLWSHVAAGGRIYAESAGLAYLCRELVMPCGQSWSMVGLLPALAHRHPNPAPDRAVEFSTTRGSWLFPSNECVRGYLSNKWIIHPDGSLIPLVSQSEHSHDLVGDYRIVGSRFHLNFAARPDHAERFFQPCRKAHLRPVS